MPNKITNENKKIFEENVASSWVEWRTAFQNFIDYMESMAKDENVSECEIAVETRRCSELLLTKKINPLGISMSFCNWRDEFSEG